MGRLFWKLFFVFWLAMLTAGGSVGTVVWLRHQAHQQAPTNLALHAATADRIDAAEAVLRSGGVAALRRLLKDWDGGHAPKLYAVDDANRDLLGRPLPPSLLAQARNLLRQGDYPKQVRRIAADGTPPYVLFAAASEPGHTAEIPPPPPPSPLVPITAGLVTSLAFSAWLARYLAGPIRHLQTAFSALAAGRLETRIGGLTGSRRDELSDLGRHFDHMAGQIGSLVDAQRRLLHDVSHELRSPLARLHAAIGLARQQPDTIDASLERIERESGRLDTLVGELLTLSRLEGSMPGTMADRIDLGELLDDIIADARFEAEEKGIRVACPESPEIPIHGHAELLHRAVENVVRNAIQHGPAGGTVELRLSVLAGHVVVTVLDEGPGVPEHQLGSIFEPFFRGHGTHSRCGVGLGLTITRRAVEAHGGRVSAHNRPEGGLCIEIDLPLRSRTSDELPAPQSDGR